MGPGRLVDRPGPACLGGHFIPLRQDDSMLAVLMEVLYRGEKGWIEMAPGDPKMCNGAWQNQIYLPATFPAIISLLWLVMHFLGSYQVQMRCRGQPAHDTMRNPMVWSAYRFSPANRGNSGCEHAPKCRRRRVFRGWTRHPPPTGKGINWFGVHPQTH